MWERHRAEQKVSKGRCERREHAEGTLSFSCGLLDLIYAAIRGDGSEGGFGCWVGERDGVGRRGLVDGDGAVARDFSGLERSMTCGDEIK